MMMSFKIMNNVDIDLSKNYYWTELHPQVDAPLLPDMLYGEGVRWPIRCRLQGEATKGMNATEAKERVALFDLDYCVAKLKSRVKHLSKADCEHLFTEVLSRFETDKQTEHQSNEETERHPDDDVPDPLPPF